MPSTQPETAVANSAKKKIRPRSSAPLVDSVNTAWPALRSASVLASSSASGSSSLLEVGEHAVVAVALGVPDRLVGHRQDSLVLLAGRLGDQLLDPQAEAPDRFGHDERELVPTLQRQLAHRQSQPQTRVRGRGVEAVAVGLCLLSRGQHRLDIDPHQRSRNQPEVRQHRVAAADVGVVLEHPSEPTFRGQVHEARPGIGDSHELPALAHPCARRSTSCGTASPPSRPTWRRR